MNKKFNFQNPNLDGVRIEFNFYNEKATLLAAIQKQWVRFLKVNRQKDAPVCVALSGGRIAPELFDSLAAITLECILKKQIDQRILKNIHFFWADERCVPQDSSESNYNIANIHLFQPLKIKQNQIHRIKGELEPAPAAQLAINDWLNIAEKKRNPVFDLIMLGMGEDGHVASLFPEEPEEVVLSDIVYRPVVASKPPPHRITLGYLPIINAKRVWVVITGNNKQNALYNSLPPQFSTPLGRVLKLRNSTNLFYCAD
ncbi:MAG: 6-phosphogluconolactonase [Verrucomicrobiia bacterium]